MKRKVFLLVMLFVLLFSLRAEARQGFAIGLGPVGNIYVIDTIPIMDPGVGGHVFFNYRFQEQLAFQASFLMAAQDGANVSANDGGILFLAMPAMDLKYYFLREDPRWDPYIGTGLGLYWLTEGRTDNNTGGVGLGAQLGVGFDFYLTETISLGFEGVFRSIGLVTNLGTPSASTAIFPYSLLGNIAFHF